jgi:hypothetical protein
MKGIYTTRRKIAMNFPKNILRKVLATSVLKKNIAGHWWLTLVNLTTQEAEFKRIVVQSQPGQIV